VLLRIQIFWDVMLGCCMFPGILKDHIAFKTLGVACPLIQCHVVEGVNPQECVHNSEIPLRLVLYSPRDPRLVLASH
jgi:hypothetical protein